MFFRNGRKLLAGHSHWHNIKHKKAATDAVKAQQFQKLSMHIVSAIRNGGPDPATNLLLESALARAREGGLPRERVDAALAKAQGKDKAEFHEILYEAALPGGVFVLVDAATDSRNRTAQEVNKVINDHGASLSKAGSVLRFFEKRGLLVVPAEDPAQLEAHMLAAMDVGGVEDVQPADDGKSLRIWCSAKELAHVGRHVTSALGLPPGVLSASMETVCRDPAMLVEPTEEATAFVDALETLQDVKAVFSTLDPEAEP